MKILVVNAGSSSLKFQLIDMTNEEVIAKGNCERIGIDGKYTYTRKNSDKIQQNCDFPTHKEALLKISELLTDKENGVIGSMDEISAVGHRIVQGAECFKESVLATDDVIDKINSLSDLAPLHNPAHVLALNACKDVIKPGTPQVVVFDTSFHCTIPKKAYLYAIPYSYYEDMHIRKYGFHGTSHRYVSQEAANLMGKPLKKLKMVTCHLGNGSSVSAIQEGKCIDTTMGFTPLDGMIMGTRSGSVDPSVITYIMNKQNMSPKEMSDMLNKRAGYLGVSGISSDDRDIHEAAENGNERAQLVLDIQSYEIKKYIGSFAAAMGGLDVVVFTGGIGENSWQMRRDVCRDMEYFGIEIDEKLNKEQNGQAVKLSLPGSKTEVWIVPTNEELLIARDTLKIVENL